MAYNEIYAQKQASGINYIKYTTVAGTGGKTTRVQSKTCEDIPAITVKFPSKRINVDKGYGLEEPIQIAVPYDYVTNVIGGISHDDVIEIGGIKYRVEDYVDMSRDPLWGVYVIDLRRIKYAT